MPYFGGPGNNYSLHAICKMVETLRHDQTKIGLVQAMSWFISKHAVGVYSGTPRSNQWKIIPPENYQKELDTLRGPKLINEASGDALVETFTTFYDKMGRPMNAVIIGRLDDGSRFISKTEIDEKIVYAMMEQEIIGVRGKVRSKDGFNIFQF
jgi:acetyl-CoA C-acetyltransferase